MARRRHAAVGLVALAVALAAATGTDAPSGGRHAVQPSGLAAAAAGLPAPARPAFEVARPRLLDGDETTARIAPVVRRAVARSRPGIGGEPVAAVSPLTEEGATHVLLVLGEAPTKEGLWVRVRLPVLPNGRTGWLPRRALGGYRFVNTRLVVDRARRTVSLLEDGRQVFSAPIGIGTPDAPTPAGEFYVRLRLTGFGDPFYGPVAFGTNARSEVLTDWPGGGYIGIHGTNAPELIPGRVSHGCIRLRNRDILELSRLMPVGTPLTIR